MIEINREVGHIDYMCKCSFSYIGKNTSKISKDLHKTVNYTKYSNMTLTFFPLSV